MWAGACHSELVKEVFRTRFSPSSVWYPVIKLRSQDLMQSVVPLPARPPFWSIFLISVPLSGSTDAHSTITKSYPGIQRTDLSKVTLPSRRPLSPVTCGTRMSYYTLNIGLGFWRNISSPGLGFCVMGWVSSTMQPILPHFIENGPQEPFHIWCYFWSVSHSLNLCLSFHSLEVYFKSAFVLQ